MTVPRSLHRVLALSGIVEVIGVSVGTAGLAVEFIYGAHLGFILITGGALVFAIGSGLWAKVFVALGR